LKAKPVTTHNETPKTITQCETQSSPPPPPTPPPNNLKSSKVDDVILVLDEELRPAACGLASQLRAAGRSVDLQLEPRKKMKAAIKAAERAGADRLLIVGGDEWGRGAVAVRDLRAFEQREVAVGELVAAAEAAGAAAAAAGAVVAPSMPA
jgi:histidyl-tRNA synthetase